MRKRRNGWGAEASQTWGIIFTLDEGKLIPGLSLFYHEKPSSANVLKR